LPPCRKEEEWKSAFGDCSVIWASRCRWKGPRARDRAAGRGRAGGRAGTHDPGRGGPGPGMWLRIASGDRAAWAAASAPPHRLEHRLAEPGGAVGHGDAGGFHRLDLVLGAALAAGDDGARMAHAPARGR